MEDITPRATLPSPELVKSAKEAALDSAIACGIEVEDVMDLDSIENVRSMVRTIWGSLVIRDGPIEGGQDTTHLSQILPPKYWNDLCTSRMLRAEFG